MKNKKAIATIGIIAIIAILIIIFSPSPMIVLSGSMVPIMMPGDIILITPVNTENIRVNDIITFAQTGRGGVVTHRIISETVEGYQTKGDANEDNDKVIVQESDVIGKTIFVIPYVGYLPKITKDPKIFFIVVIIPALLIIIDEIRLIIKYSNPMKLRKMERDEKRAKREIPRKINYCHKLSHFLRLNFQ